MKLVFLSVHSRYWSCSHWIHVHLIYLKSREMSPTKSLLMHKKHLQPGVYLIYTCIFLYMVLNMTKTNMTVSCRAFAESAGLWFWILCSAVFLGNRKLFFCYFAEITSLFLKIQFALHQAGRTFGLLKYLSCGLSDIWNMNVVVFSKVRWLIHILIKKTFFLDSKDLMWNVILYSVSVCSFISNGLTYCVISIHDISLINFSMNNFRVRLIVKTS